MKYNFSFLQVINWLVACKNNLLKIEEEIEKKTINDKQLIEKLKSEKRKLLLVKDILNRKTKLQGINTDFLKNFKKLKKDYGIED